MGVVCPEVVRPERVNGESLLRAEYSIIERVQEHWNHPGAVLERGLGGELDREDREICLVMPACDGTTLAQLSREEQRELFPAMLPALWRALSKCPHGDLKPSSMLIDFSGRFFRILDPGVSIDGPSRKGEAKAGGLDLESRLFTTNIFYYSLLFPEQGPERPKLCAPYSGLLARLLGAYEYSSAIALARVEQAVHPVDGVSPAAADLVALGAIYAHILTGVPLHELLNMNAPLWSGRWSGRAAHREISAPSHPHLEQVEDGRLFGKLESRGASSSEAELCVQLIALRFDSEKDLVRFLQTRFLHAHWFGEVVTLGYGDMNHLSVRPSVVGRCTSRIC